VTTGVTAGVTTAGVTTAGGELDCVESFDVESFDELVTCEVAALWWAGFDVVPVALVVVVVVVFATAVVDATFRVLVCPSGALATTSTRRPVPRTAATVRDRLTRFRRVRAASRVACARVRIGPP
jgi:hypothetical protein